MRTTTPSTEIHSRVHLLRENWNPVVSVHFRSLFMLNCSNFRDPSETSQHGKNIIKTSANMDALIGGSISVRMSFMTILNNIGLRRMAACGTSFCNICNICVVDRVFPRRT